jgi:8-oxo-dGTP diphosphatase
LVRRGIEPFHGCWDTPGGFIEEGEEASDAALRELREETGLEGHIVGLIGVWGDHYGDTHAATMNVFYRAIVDDISSATANSDVTDLGWFAIDELPRNSDIAFDCVPKAIGAWRAQREASKKWSSGGTGA